MLVKCKMEQLVRLDRLDRYTTLTMTHENRYDFSDSLSSPSSFIDKYRITTDKYRITQK
jgi:hypothetical protein